MAFREHVALTHVLARRIILYDVFNASFYIHCISLSGTGLKLWLHHLLPTVMELNCGCSTICRDANHYNLGVIINIFWSEYEHFTLFITPKIWHSLFKFIVNISILILEIWYRHYFSSLKVGITASGFHYMYTMFCRINAPASINAPRNF